MQASIIVVAREKGGAAVVNEAIKREGGEARGETNLLRRLLIYSGERKKRSMYDILKPTVLKCSVLILHFS